MKRRLSGVQLATRTGMDQSYLSKLETGKAGFSEIGLTKIARALGTTVPGLFGATNVEPANLSDRYRVPILDYVQAGQPVDLWSQLTDEDIQGYVAVDFDNAEDLFALVIRGSSMLPEFEEGNIVIIQTSMAPQPGDYVVAVNGNGEAVFKRYKVLKTDAQGRTVFSLVPLNDDFPTLRSDEQQLLVRGTMVEHRRIRRR